MSFSVNSKIKLNFGAIRKLDINSKIALEQTTDALLTEIKNAQVMPFDDEKTEIRKFGVRGEMAKNGRRYKGKLVGYENVGGNLQNENTFADYTRSSMGRTQIVSNTPYARRLYFHPEYNFDKGENRSAGGKWLKYWLKGGTRENFCAKQFAEIYRRLNNL